MLLKLANKIPPFLCRMLARKRNGRVPKSHADIAKSARLSRDTVSRISLMADWNRVDLATADAFAKACGVNLAYPTPTLKRLKANGAIHLKNGNAEQRRFFQRIINARATARV